MKIYEIPVYELQAKNAKVNTQNKHSSLSFTLSKLAIAICRTIISKPINTETKVALSKSALWFLRAIVNKDMACFTIRDNA